MKEVNKDVLKEAANKLMFDMKDEEYDTLLKEFNIVIHRMKLIGKIKGIDDVEPMTFPFDVTTDYLRDDVACLPCTREEILQNASDVVEGQIRLPKVVG